MVSNKRAIRAMIGTLEQLFDYEQVEDAWIAILGRSDKCYVEFSDADKDASVEPYIEVQLNSVVPTGHLYPYRDEQLPDVWKGVLISRVVTVRGFNSDKHREMVGRVRLAIHRYARSFKMPYHEVLQMRETTLSRGVDETLDWSEIHAEVVFCIREDAWPK